MERDEKHTQPRQNDNADQIARSLEAEQKATQREHTRKMNKLWIWLGVLILIAIIIWFIFGLGMFEAFGGK